MSHMDHWNSKLLKCKNCGSEAELDFDAVVELSPSGDYQTGMIDCKQEGKKKICWVGVKLTFEANYPPKDLSQQLVDSWNKLNAPDTQPRQ
jgi:hypothetical protein